MSRVRVASCDSIRTISRLPALPLTAVDSLRTTSVNTYLQPLSCLLFKTDPSLHQFHGYYGPAKKRPIILLALRQGPPRRQRGPTLSGSQTAGPDLEFLPPRARERGEALLFLSDTCTMSGVVDCCHMCRLLLECGGVHGTPVGHGGAA